MIDIRSDTVTKPSAGMREAMMNAEVGDDVFGEDPSINRLQEIVAELLGKEAALYLPSGTMANQISINVHTQPGNEVICEVGCHLYNYEAGGPALLSGVMLRTLEGHMGSFTADQVKENIRPDNSHFAQSALIALENTHNRAGGTIFPIEQIKEISALARERDINMHLDGARLLNAVAATGIAADEWASYFDSASICLSKGLGGKMGTAHCYPVVSTTSIYNPAKTANIITAQFTGLHNIIPWEVFLGTTCVTNFNLIFPSTSFNHLVSPLYG